MKRWQHYLQELGLSDSETKIYLALLQDGALSVQEIARGTRLSRVTVYASIKTLGDRGILTSVEKGKRLVYAVEPPERLVALEHRRAQKAKAMAEEMQAHMQELKLVQSGDKPIVKLYEGHDAFKALQADVLESRTSEIVEFGNLDEIKRTYQTEDMKPFFHELTKRRVKRRLIYLAKEATPYKDEENKEIRHLKTDGKEFFGDIFLYDNKVWLSSFRGKQISVLVESQVIKDTIQGMFDQIWKKLG